MHAQLLPKFVSAPAWCGLRLAPREIAGLTYDAYLRWKLRA